MVWCAVDIVLVGMPLLAYLSAVSAARPLLNNIAPQFHGYVDLVALLGLGYSTFGLVVMAALLKDCSSNPNRWLVLKLGAVYPYRSVTGALGSLLRSRWLRPLLTAGLLGLGVWQIQENYGQQMQTWYEHRKNYQRWHDYLQSTQSIQQKNQKNWWNGDRAANAAELAWLQETRDLAQQGMPLARFQWTILGCYGMQDGSLGTQLNEGKASTCGREIGTALRLAAQAHARIPDMVGWPAILEDTRSLLQRSLYAHAWGLLAPPAQTNASFALALLDGLESVAVFDDFLAYAMADIQACWLKPAQTEAAQRTLQGLVERFPKTELAEKARGDLSQHLNSFCAP